MANEKMNLAGWLYKLRADWEDRRLGGVSVDVRKPSRFAAEGAEATQSSDYRCLDRIFRTHVPLTAQDVLLDVGCGEGRVLTYLYLHKAKCRLMGVELDPEVTATAQKRVEGCPGIDIRCANILQARDLMQQVTVYYLFNPFNGKIFSKFVAALEKEVPHPIRMVYLFDYYAAYLDGRPGWTRLAGETFQRTGGEQASYSVYAFDPAVYKAQMQEKQKAKQKK